MKKTDLHHGFTGIELLIVVGAISLLIYSIIITLQPIEILKESRDTERLADLGVLSSALNYHLANSSSSKLSNSEDFSCDLHFGASSKTAENSPWSNKTLAHGGIFELDGSGWIAIDLTTSNIGLYDEHLPKDPLNNEKFFYAFSCDELLRSFELNANLESKRFRSEGSEDKESKDGGDNSYWYEIGNIIQSSL